MFLIGTYVQLRDSGLLGRVVNIASARQTLTIETIGGETVRLRADAVRLLDPLEWRMLQQQAAAMEPGRPRRQVGSR